MPVMTQDIQSVDALKQGLSMHPQTRLNNLYQSQVSKGSSFMSGGTMPNSKAGVKNHQLLRNSQMVAQVLPFESSSKALRNEARISTSNKGVKMVGMGSKKKSNIIAAYGPKVPSRATSKERQFQASNIQASDYSSQMNDSTTLPLNLQTIQQTSGVPNISGGVGYSLDPTHPSNFNTISYHESVQRKGDFTNKSQGQRGSVGNIGPNKDVTKRSGTTGGTCSGLGTAPLDGNPAIYLGTKKDQRLGASNLRKSALKSQCIFNPTSSSFNSQKQMQASHKEALRNQSQSALDAQSKSAHQYSDLGPM
jgi:hypothetical protein